jgi:hypothetical protein
MDRLRRSGGSPKDGSVCRFQSPNHKHKRIITRAFNSAGRRCGLMCPMTGDRGLGSADRTGTHGLLRGKTDSVQFYKSNNRFTSAIHTYVTHAPTVASSPIQIAAQSPSSFAQTALCTDLSGSPLSSSCPPLLYRFSELPSEPRSVSPFGLLGPVFHCSSCSISK